MAYVPGFEHDIFISYAHVDNASDNEDGWVTRLHASLLKLIPQKIGRAENFSIWRDPKLGGNDDFIESIDAAFRRSAITRAISSRSRNAETRRILDTLSGEIFLLWPLFPVCCANRVRLR